MLVLFVDRIRSRRTKRIHRTTNCCRPRRNTNDRSRTPCQKCEQAMDFAGEQVRNLIEAHPDYFPMYTAERQVEARRRSLDQLVRGLSGRPAVAALSAHRRCLLAGQGRTLLAPGRASQDRPQCPRSGLPLLVNLETLVRSHRRRGDQRRGDRGRADAGHALQGEGPIPALLCGRREPLHRHHDECGHHLLRRPGDRRRGSVAHRQPALPDHAPLSGARRRQHLPRGHLRPGDGRVPAPEHPPGLAR